MLEKKTHLLVSYIVPVDIFCFFFKNSSHITRKSLIRSYYYNNIIRFNVRQPLIFLLWSWHASACPNYTRRRRPVWKSSGAESRVRTPSAAGCLHTTHARETVAGGGGGVGPPKTQTTARGCGIDGGGARSASDGRSIRMVCIVERLHTHRLFMMWRCYNNNIYLLYWCGYSEFYLEWGGGENGVCVCLW